MGETVVLIHGLGRTRRSFWRMEQHLRRAGFETMTLSYPFRPGNIAQLAARLGPQLPQDRPVHIVGHSLGGILALLIMRARPPGLRGRIVQLGSPNLGSSVAKRLKPVRAVFGSVLKELEPGHLGPGEGLDVAAIAGTGGPRMLDPLTGHEGPNDMIVSVESAHAAAPPEHRITFPVVHTLIMMDKRVITATTAFLGRGSLRVTP